MYIYIRATSRRGFHFAFFFISQFCKKKNEKPSSLHTDGRCARRDFKRAHTSCMSSSNGREGHTRMMAVARARARASERASECAGYYSGISHLVRFHRQKCRRRICSFRHDAVAVDHPYCSPRQSGSQTEDRRGIY